MYGKIENGILVTPPKFYNGIVNYDKCEKFLKRDGWKEIIYTEPNVELDEDQRLMCKYDETEDGKITQVWFAQDIETYELIQKAKEQIQSTDYKIIKYAEYQLAGLEAPYDIESLHQERQALRDKINQLEEDN